MKSSDGVHCNKQPGDTAGLSQRCVADDRAVDLTDSGVTHNASERNGSRLHQVISDFQKLAVVPSEPPQSAGNDGKVKRNRLRLKFADSSGSDSKPRIEKTVLPETFTEAERSHTDKRLHETDISQLTDTFKFGKIFGSRTQVFKANLVKTKLGDEHFPQACLFNASLIRLCHDQSVIAMARPELFDDSGRFYFWDMLIENKIHHLIDLTDKVCSEGVRYDKSAETTQRGIKLKVTVSELNDIQNVSVSFNALQAISVRSGDTEPVTITRYHFTQWRDNSGLDVDKFMALVDFYAGKIKEGVLVHCLEGMGRTMTLIAGEEIRQKINGGSITADNYQVQCVYVINELAKQRGNCVIKTPEQKLLLITAAQSWLGEKPDLKTE